MVIIWYFEVCSSFFDEFTDEPKMAGSSLAANVQLGRGRSEGVFRLSGSLWLSWCYG